MGKEIEKEKNIIIEGEYINEKRNGKGKEYYENGKLKFEGEYLKGKKWNEKGYDVDGNNIYEINNGTGKIKEYNISSTIKFEGEYLKGEKNGKGKQYD